MKEKKILAAGTYYFSLMGLEGTRIGDITKKAGIAKGSFYTYFANKEELLEKIMEVKINEYILFCKRLNNSDTGLEEKMRIYLEEVFRSLIDEPKFFYMTQRLFGSSEAALPGWLILKIGKRGDRYLREILRKNIDDIAVEYRDEVELIAASIAASLYSYQKFIVEMADVEITTEKDYKKISRALKKRDISRYISQFYNLNIKGIIKTD